MKNSITKFNTTSRAFIGASFAVASLLMMSAPAFASDMLTRQLDQGMTGSDVSSLQSFLAKDATLYPQGLVTGYYGTLTTSAVSNFQARNGIASVGRVGPVTLIALNQQMAGGMANNGIAPSIMSVAVSTNRNSAVINWNTNESAKGVVYYSTSPLTTYERQNSVDVSGAAAMTDTNFRTTQNVQLSGLASGTTYYYLVYTTDQDGNVTVSTPATFNTLN
jgi:peptidoglycan hydrolase-like protein with peptidoglycan-binding domain